MKDKRIYYGAMDKSSSDQQIYVNILIFCIVRKAGPILPLLVGLMANRQSSMHHACMHAGKQGGEQGAGKQGGEQGAGRQASRQVDGWAGR